MSEEAAKQIYFEILLKMSCDFFSPKIYDCLEMVFMRLNEDGRILTYENQTNDQNCSYFLNKVEFIGIEKIYYLLFWADQKVSKKVKDFLFKLYCFGSSPETK